MTTRTVHLALPGRGSSYDIVIGAPLGRIAREIIRRFPVATTFVITDATVARLHARAFAEALGSVGRGRRRVHLLSFPSGERSKNRATRDRLEDALLSRGVERGSLIVAFGGGVVGDLAGFVASSVLRGIAFVQVPTTLLAQVDASVGGKVAIDHPRGKNLLGAFHQPSGVYIDPSLLSTLPERHYRAGLAEVVKIAAVRDRAFFAWLERDAARLLRRDRAALARAIERSCRLKAALVASDEREAGPRRLLNFGHTIGHAVEAMSSYRMLHGEAVAVGMAAEARLSVRLGLAREDDARRLVALLEQFGLPTRLPASADLGALSRFIARDKKVSGSTARYTLLRRIGAGVAGVPVDRPTLRAHWPL